jgi:hypothetical protein
MSYSPISKSAFSKLPADLRELMIANNVQIVESKVGARGGNEDIAVNLATEFGFTEDEIHVLATATDVFKKFNAECNKRHLNANAQTAFHRSIDTQVEYGTVILPKETPAVETK